MVETKGILLKNTVIVEGFEMVGKSTLIENLLVRDNGFVNYHATHDLTDRTIGRNNSWTIGYGVLDFLSQYNREPYKRFDLKVAIDRGVFSSYVYQKLYGPVSDLNYKIVDWYKRNNFFHEDVTHLYVKPADETVSRMLWDKSRERPENPNFLSNKYDKFSSFEEYWEMFKKADELFKEAYRAMNVKPYEVQVELNGTYSFWEDK